MSGQLCAGNPPSFLEALTMPTITNARASIDYDWDGAPVRYHFLLYQYCISNEMNRLRSIRNP
jgi:hypothetical protein